MWSRTTKWSLPLVVLALAGCTSLAMRDPGPADFATAPKVWSGFLQSSGVTQTTPDSTWWAGFNDPILTKLIESAVIGNLDLSLARERVREARALARRDTLTYKPRADLSASVTGQRQSETSALPVGRIPQFESENLIYSAGFDASWEIALFGRDQVTEQIAMARISSAQEQRRDVALSLISEIARQYVILRGAQAELATIRANAARQSRIVELTRTKRDHGEASDLDVERAELVHFEYAAREPGMVSAIRLAKMRLAVLTGQPPNLDLSFLDPPQATLQPPRVVAIGLTSDLLRRRPDVRKTERNYALAAHQLKLTALQTYPRFSLFGSGGPETIDLSDLFDADSLALSLGALLTWPLLNRGEQEINKALATSSLRQAELAYKNAVLNALEDVEAAATHYVSDGNTAQRHTQIVAARSRIADMSRIRYEAGTGTLLDVLATERDLADATLQLTRTRTRKITQLVALYKALGGGWEISDEEQVSLSEARYPDGRDQ